MTAKAKKSSTKKPATRRAAKIPRAAAPVGGAKASLGAGATPPSVAAQLPRIGATEVAAAKRKFEQGVIARSEAVPAGMSLPPVATHEIVGKARDGSPVLKRKRFSLK